MPRPLDLLYLLALVLAAPWLAWRYAVQGKDRGGWFVKLTGRVEPRAGVAPCVWLHAVSVGEALQLPGILTALAEERPDAVPVVTVSTDTGLVVARQKLPGVAVHRAPLDFSWAVGEFLARVRPDACVLVELEVWPNWVRVCSEAGVPVAVANARLSANSFRGYRRLKRLLRPTFRRLAWVGAQTDAYAARFAALGTDPARVAVTGSVKFDGAEADPANPRTRALGRAFGLRPGEPVLLAGSTGEPEEEIVLDAFAALRRTPPRPATAHRPPPRRAVRRGRGLDRGAGVFADANEPGER